MSIIAPSILSMDFRDTKKAMEQLCVSEAKWLHFDVMDGHFVPNISFGTDVLKAMKETGLFLDVHVMISDPFFYAQRFIDAGAQGYTFHYEALKNDEDRENLIQFLKKQGIKAGMSIKPKTDVEVLYPFLKSLDLVLVMSVEPGFGGQSFDESSLTKIEKLRQKIDEQHYDCLIEVDGGINDQTATLVKEAGVDVLVAGSYIFKQDIVEGVKSLL